MDPNYTLQLIDFALRMNGDGEGAREYAGYLREWIVNGGFEPDWSKYPLAYAYYLHRDYLRYTGNELFSHDDAIAKLIQICVTTEKLIEAYKTMGGN